MDRLDHAATILQRRARRTRALCAVGLVIGGLVVGSLGYVAVRDYFLTRFGMSSPIAVGTLTLLPLLALSFAAARTTGRWMVSVRRASWIEQIARNEGVNRDDLEELTRF